MSIPDILNVFIIALLFFLVFGIFCVNYFKGGFFYCELTESIDTGSGTMEQFTLQSQDFIHLNKQIDTQQQCVKNGGTWLNRDTNFDNTLNATMLLFQMSTTEGWVDVMFWGIQSRGIEKSPLRNNNVPWGIFFIIIFVVGSLFLINLFVGVVIKKFEQMKQILGKNFLLTSAQREWISVRLMAFKFQPKVRIEKKIKNRCRRGLYMITSSSCFEWFIMISIFINTALMAITWYGQPETVKSTFQVLNYIFAGIFTIEAILKITAMGKIYFHSGWNWFDFVIVCGTLISILVANLTSLNIGTQATLVRAFRIGRIFRLIHRAKSLKMIFDTFMITIPSLANVGAILLLLIYIYAILGVNLFATVKLQQSLNRHANFQSFGLAFLTLMRASTGQAWNSVMHDTARQNSSNFSCTNDPSYLQIKLNGINGCGSTFAYFYFISFVIIVSFIYLNLFIAIILQGFSDTSEQANLTINQQTYEDFRQKWSDYDCEGTGLILVKDLPKLLGQLDPPLGIPSQYQKNINVKRQVLANLRLPSYQRLKYFHFSDVLQALTRQSLLKQKAKQILIRKREQAQDKQNNSIQFIEENKIVDQFRDITEALDEKNHQSAQAVIYKNMIKTQKKMTKKLNKHLPDQMGSQYLWAAWVITRHLQRKVQQRKLKENLSIYIDKSKKDKKQNVDFVIEQGYGDGQFNTLQNSIAQNVGSISIEQVQFTQMIGGVSFQSQRNAANRSAVQNNIQNYSQFSNQKRTIQSLNTRKNCSYSKQLPAYNQSWESQKEQHWEQNIQYSPRSPQNYIFIDNSYHKYSPRSQHISHDAVKQLREIQESSISYSRPQSPHQKELQNKQRIKRRFSSMIFSPQKLMMSHSSSPPPNNHYHHQQIPYSPKFAQQQQISYPNMTLMLGTCSTPVSEKNFDFTMTDKKSTFAGEKRSRLAERGFDQKSIEERHFDIEIDELMNNREKIPQFGESHIRAQQIDDQPNIGYLNKVKTKHLKLPPVNLSQSEFNSSQKPSRYHSNKPFYTAFKQRNDDFSKEEEEEDSVEEKKPQLQVSFADQQFNSNQNDNIKEKRLKHPFSLEMQPQISEQLKNEIEKNIQKPKRYIRNEHYYQEQDQQADGNKNLQEIDEHRVQTDQRGHVCRKLTPLQLFATLSSGISSHDSSQNKDSNFEDDNMAQKAKKI